MDRRTVSAGWRLSLSGSIGPTVAWQSAIKTWIRFESHKGLNHGVRLQDEGTWVAHVIRSGSLYSTFEETRPTARVSDLHADKRRVAVRDHRSRENRSHCRAAHLGRHSRATGFATRGRQMSAHVLAPNDTLQSTCETHAAERGRSLFLAA
jgi:hypothetical protein